MASARGLRTSRSSRYSSPAIAQKDPELLRVEAPGLKNGEKTFLDRWVEPPVAPSQPSYKDSRGDGQGFGVLEHMAPLGQPPSQKLMQKLKINGPRLSFRATTGTPVQSEEVLTPATEVDRIDLASPVDTESATEPIVISSPERGRPRNQEVEQRPPQENVTPSPVKLSFAQSNNTSPLSTMSPRQRGPEDIAFHLHTAIQEAERDGTRKLIPGLQKLRQEVLFNPGLSSMLEAVSRGSTTRDEFRTFKRYIKSGIRQYNNGPANESMLESRTPSVNPNTSPLPQVVAQSGTFSQSSHSTSPGQNPTYSSSSINPPTTLAQIPSPLSHRTSPMKKVSRSPASTANMSNGRLRADPSQPRHGVSPSKRRSGSVSSSSSLSSAKSIPEDFAPELDGDRVNGGRSVRSSGAPRQAAKQRTRPSSILPPSSDHPFSHFNNVSKFAAKKLKKSKDEPDYDREAVDRLRREFHEQSFHDYNHQVLNPSDERTDMHSHPSSTMTLSVNTIPPPVVHAHPLDPSQAILSSPTASIAPAFETRLQNGTSRKRGYHEIDKDDEGIPTPRSTSPAVLVPPPPPGVVGSSRAVTPRAAKLPPASKRKSARVMVSPNKPKNGGITAGVSRAGAGRDAIGSGVDSDDEQDNEEYCASCSGEGQLLCCDGCPNSFHHACLEPPLDPDDEIEGEWFCPPCVARRQKNHTTVTGPVTGLFGRIAQRVDDTIPKAFSLPWDIREYFEGVKTGDEGEYEEIGLSKTQNNTVKLNRAGFVDEPDYKASRDSKGKLITCYLCGQTSHGRDIIPCDFCPARWHLDCLNPPLAVPPRRRIGDKPNAIWRCPLHTEQDLTNLGRMQEAAPGDLGRIPRLRKPKNAATIHVDLGRGFRSNGVIDVELEPDRSDIREESMHGRVYSISEQSVKLDFIDRVKKSWYEDQSFPRLLNARKHIRESLYRPDLSAFSKRESSPTPAQDIHKQFLAAQIEANARANAVLRHKSFREQQAALNLANLHVPQNGGAVSAAGVSDLINQLVVDAPPAVAQAVQRDERERLLRLQQLVEQRLALLGEVGKEKEMVNGNRGRNATLEEDDEGGSDVEMDLGA